MLSLWKSASALYNTAKFLLNEIPNLVTQQTRTTFILKRKYPTRLHKIGRRPHKLKHKDFIYELIEDTDIQNKPPLDIILTQYVEGFGEKGDKISLKSQRAYNDFLLPGLAVYASPDNIQKYWTDKKEKPKTYSSLYVPTCLSILKHCCLPVSMSVENPWVLEKWHIRANFRRINIITTDASITMPEKEISGPNLDNEGKEFYVTVTINKTESAIVRCRLFHDTYDPAKQLPFVPDRIKIPGKAIFSEDQEVLDSLPRPKWEEESAVK